MMFEFLASIHRSDFLPIIFLSKSEWNRSSNLTNYGLKSSLDDATEAEDKEDMSYNQQHLVATSTMRRAHRFPPRDTH